MTTPIFSICHATYGRPEKAVAAMRMWFERASRPEAVEYVFAVNIDDPSAPALMALLDSGGMPFKTVLKTSKFAGSAPAWDSAAAGSTGQILIQAQDDLLPPHGWDSAILDRMASLAYRNSALNGRLLDTDTPTVLAVSDGYRIDDLLCTAIMNRARYVQQGHFLFPGYASVYSDDEHSVRAYADEAEGKCVVIRARDLVFRHEHAYHLKQEPDATYQRQNSPANYAQGAALFAQRNGHLMKYRTWS